MRGNSGNLRQDAEKEVGKPSCGNSIIAFLFPFSVVSQLEI
jgi:hypothetical protein